MSKRSNKLMALIGLLAAAAMMLAACQPAAPAVTATPAGPVEIKIAFFGPLTGPAATLGQEQLALGRLAVADFNTEMAGFHATMVEEDTDITPDKAVPVCQKDADDKSIVGVIGPSGSGQVEACAQILEDAGLAHVSPSATRPSLSQGGFKTFFRVVPNDDAQGRDDANYIAKTIGAKKVYVVDDQESYGTNLADTVDKILKDAGVETERASVAQTDNDLSALVTKIKAFGAEVVFFAGQVPEQGALMAKQLREQGVNIPVFGGDGFYSQNGFIGSAGGANEGSFASVFFPDIRQKPEAASVVAAADKAFPTWGNFGAATYVAVTVMLDAAANASKAGHLDRAGVLDAVSKTDIKVFGLPIKFESTGEVVGASFVISQVKGDKFVQVFP